MTNTNLFLNLITPIKTPYKDFVSSISFEDHGGERMILKDYSPVIGIVKSGLLKIKTLNGEEIVYIVDDGCYIVSNNEIKIIVNHCIKNDEQSIEKAIEKRNKNLNILKKVNIDINSANAELYLIETISKLKNK